ncbi:MAG: hypothetical protein PHV37_09215 [Candidatus Gastranaerophilales bacterium]|nr:hypothetical protein [Candidatus Gastranaerophilales bacterium]
MKKNRRFKRDMQKQLRDISFENSTLKMDKIRLIDSYYKKSARLIELENFIKHPTIEHKIYNENVIDIYGAADHTFQMNIPFSQPLRYVTRVDNRLYESDERFKSCLYGDMIRKFSEKLCERFVIKEGE